MEKPRILTEEQRELLSAYGIHGKSQDISILDYPKIAAWFKGDKGELFLSGDKGVILHGGWEATKIGYAIMRWLTLVERQSGIVDLWEFADVDDRIIDIGNERYLFIKNFQTEAEGKCPLNQERIASIESFIINRFSNNKPTILECYYKTLMWYSAKFREFINDCYLVLDVHEQRS